MCKEPPVSIVEHDNVRQFSDSIIDIVSVACKVYDESMVKFNQWYEVYQDIFSMTVWKFNKGFLEFYFSAW